MLKLWGAKFLSCNGTYRFKVIYEFTLFHFFHKNYNITNRHTIILYYGMSNIKYVTLITDKLP